MKLLTILWIAFLLGGFWILVPHTSQDDGRGSEDPICLLTDPSC